MKYDASVDALYIPFKKGKYSHSEVINEDTILDVNSKGEALGLEILDASLHLSKAGMRLKPARYAKRK